MVAAEGLWTGSSTLPHLHHIRPVNLIIADSERSSADIRAGRDRPRCPFPVRAGPVVQVSSIAALEGAGYRLTGPRRAVADLITRREGHSPGARATHPARGPLHSRRSPRQRGGPQAGNRAGYDLQDARSTRGRGCDRADRPALRRPRLQRLRAGRSSSSRRVRHVRRAADVDDTGLAGVVSKIAAESGYRIDVHRLELFGLCPTCQHDLQATRDGVGEQPGRRRRARSARPNDDQGGLGVAAGAGVGAGAAALPIRRTPVTLA